MDPKPKPMMFLTVLCLITISSIVVTVEGEYVRPLPRKTLHFPWSRKPSSYPQQVCESLKFIAVKVFKFSLETIEIFQGYAVLEVGFL